MMMKTSNRMESYIITLTFIELLINLSTKLKILGTKLRTMEEELSKMSKIMYFSQ